MLWSVFAWLLLPHKDVYVLPAYNVDCMIALQASMHRNVHAQSNAANYLQVSTLKPA